MPAIGPEVKELGMDQKKIAAKLVRQARIGAGRERNAASWAYKLMGERPMAVTLDGLARETEALAEMMEHEAKQMKFDGDLRGYQLQMGAVKKHKEAWPLLAEVARKLQKIYLR